MRCVVVGEFRNRKEVRPVVLLVVGIGPEVALDLLVCALGLTIGLWMVSGGEVEFDVQEFAQGSGELGSEGGAPVGNDIGRDTSLREDILDIQTC